MNIELSNLYPAMGSIIFSGSDVVYNLSKWESKESHVLFVTGYSGSGKTTTAKELAKRHNVGHLDTDMWMNESTYEEQAAGLLEEVCRIRRERKRTIVGGLMLIDIFTYNDYFEEFFLDDPVIIKNVSLVKSSIRAASRESEEQGKSWMKTLLNRLQLNRAFRKDFDSFVKYIGFRIVDQQVYDIYLKQIKSLFKKLFGWDIYHMNVEVHETPELLPETRNV